MLAENDELGICDLSFAFHGETPEATVVLPSVRRELAADADWGPRILEAPQVERVSALGELGVTLKILGTVRASEQWAVGGELRKRLLLAFQENGIEIPHT